VQKKVLSLRVKGYFNSYKCIKPRHLTTLVNIVQKYIYLVIAYLGN